MHGQGLEGKELEGKRPGDVREWVWSELLRQRQVVFPLPPHGHHPNSKGAAQAAEHLLTILGVRGWFSAGDTVLCYPDLVLKPLRKRLLDAGVNVVVPAKYGSGYRFLESGVVASAGGSSIAGAERLGTSLSVLPDVRACMIACVALRDDGAVLGKGYGFALPELLNALPKATVVHPLQRCAFAAATPQGEVALK